MLLLRPVSFFFLALLVTYFPLESYSAGVEFARDRERQALSTQPIIKADFVIVDKSLKRLFLMKNGTVFRDFHVTFGKAPQGHKAQEGDNRTPEGRYTLNYKKVDSDFYRAIQVSYPNAQDKQKAAALGVEPGGFIMIHGQPNGWGWLGFLRQRLNWTAGCMALTNRDMDYVWASVETGTPIEILP